MNLLHQLIPLVVGIGHLQRPVFADGLDIPKAVVGIPIAHQAVHAHTGQQAGGFVLPGIHIGVADGPDSGRLAGQTVQGIVGIGPHVAPGRRLLQQIVLAVGIALGHRLTEGAVCPFAQVVVQVIGIAGPIPVAVPPAHQPPNGVVFATCLLLNPNKNIIKA